jgi:hypothetical protein
MATGKAIICSDSDRLFMLEAILRSHACWRHVAMWGVLQRHAFRVPIVHMIASLSWRHITAMHSVTFCHTTDDVTPLGTMCLLDHTFCHITDVVTPLFHGASSRQIT